MSGLTPQQEKFCQLVASGNTYADAYRESYKVSPKTKDESIWVMSSRIMSDVKVQSRVNELREEHKKRNQATLDEVLGLMANWLRFDPIELIDEYGCVKKMKDLPKDVRQCLSSPIETLELFTGKGGDRQKIGELKTVRFVDRQKVGDMFMKKFGAYIDNKNITIENLEYLDELLKQIKK